MAPLAPNVVATKERGCGMSGGVETEAGVLSIGLLGPLRVVRFGEQLPLGGRQQKAILAILLVEADARGFSRPAGRRRVG